MNTPKISFELVELEQFLVLQVVGMDTRFQNLNPLESDKLLKIPGTSLAIGSDVEPGFQKHKGIIYLWGYKDKAHLNPIIIPTPTVRSVNQMQSMKDLVIGAIRYWTENANEFKQGEPSFVHLTAVKPVHAIYTF